MLCTVVVEKEDNAYVARDVRTGTTDQGDTIEEALENLKEALELYYEDADDSEQKITPMFTTSLEVCV